MINTLHAKWYDFHSHLLLFFLHKNFQNFICYHLSILKWLSKLLQHTFNLWLLLVIELYLAIKINMFHCCNFFQPLSFANKTSVNIETLECQPWQIFCSTLTDKLTVQPWEIFHATLAKYILTLAKYILTLAEFIPTLAVMNTTLA